MIIVGEESTIGLAKTENSGFNVVGLAESIRKIEEDSKVVRIGFPSIADISGRRYIQSVFYLDNLASPGSSIATFQDYGNTQQNGAGIILVGQNTNALALMMRAYGLPFPENFKGQRG